jgi:uncharacterized membrane protein
MDFFDAVVLWLHILAAAIFVGPQIFLAAVAMPAMRSIADVQTRQAAVRRITRGFGALGGAALGVLILTGIWNYAVVDDLGFLDRDIHQRYFIILQTKLTLVVVVLVLTGLHAMYFGRRLQQLQETGAPEAEIASVRRWSMITSMVNLAASIVILLLAALLASQWGRTAS